ncbi:MAG TPA: hypothetical protein VJ600_03235, partial [Holophagaceae bacterium]|nr:hypothetical protein [Holophagaceae bacterium]
MVKSYYAGMDLDAPCGRCKGETRHQVLTITDGVPEKLICGQCRSVHKFRAEKPKAEPVARTPRVPASAKAGAARPVSGLASQFQQLMIAEQGGAHARPYSVASRWEEGQWLDHPTFGLGRVQ